MTVALRSAQPRVQHLVARAGFALAPLDRLTAAYTLCSALILAVRAAGSDPRIDRYDLWGLAVAHSLLFLLVALAPLARAEAGRIGRVLAEWYPLAVLLAIYGSIDLVNAPRALLGLSFDAQVLEWEYRFFDGILFTHYAGYPGTTVVTWFLGLSYLAFFPLVIASPMVLWRMGRMAHARRAIFGISATFLLCYLLFLLFPVAGPAYLWGWPETQSDADLPVLLVRALNDRHDSWGSAFPSSHVAASVTATWLALAGCRRLGLVLLPFTLGILVAVVYFRIHYALDAVAGLVVAGLVVWLVSRWWPLARQPIGSAG